MLVCGLQKTTLLDYPEHIAATIFTGGCNFKCPFCHNRDLVIQPCQSPSYTHQDIFDFLKKRKNVLDGVCISGGEPTIQPDLINWLEEMKALGLSVKLDTNGYQPDVLSTLYERHLLDYVAMDIKNTPSQYARTIGIPDADFDRKRIEASMQLIKAQNVEYEFRSTIVKELHTLDAIVEMAKWIGPCKHYYLQSYRSDGNVINPIFTSYTAEDFIHFKESLQPILPTVALRGIDTGEDS